MGIITKNTKPRALNEKEVSLPYFSALVRAKRLELGLKQGEFASQVGIGLKTLRKIEQGDLNINFLKLNYLLNCLGLSMIPSELVSSPTKRKNVLFTKNAILKILQNVFFIFEIKYGITELALFGSYAKGVNQRESDIDILIDFKEAVSFEIEGEIQLILENLFQGIKVDLTLKKNLQPNFAKEIEKTKISVKRKSQIIASLS